MKLGIHGRLVIRLNQIRFKSRTSQPFLSGDAFKELSDFSINTMEDLAKLKIKGAEGSVIFCQSELVEDLIAVLKGQYSDLSLIAGNSDRDFEREPAGLVNTFRISFLQNSSISNNLNIFTLPIGIENLRLGINGLPKNLLSSIPWSKRKGSVLVGPFSPTHEARNLILSNQPFKGELFTNLTSFVPPKKYSEIVKNHKYILCPRGNGLDTHRFWEALYRGSIPIVEKSKWSESLKIMDIPMIEVESSDPEQITRQVLASDESRDFENYHPKNVKALWIDYWERRFRK